MSFLAFCAEALATYILLMAISAMFVWAFNGFSDVGQLMMLGTAALAIPGAIRIARTANLRSLLVRRPPGSRSALARDNLIQHRRPHA